MASTRKSIYINPTLTVYYTAFLSGDVIIQARKKVERFGMAQTDESCFLNKLG